MADVREGLRYTKDHEWAQVEGDRVRVGITQHAVEQLGEVTLVSIDKKVGAALTAGAAFGVVESVKAVSDLYAPVAGTLAAVNADAVKAPETLGNDPYGVWLIEIELAPGSSIAGLLSAAEYSDFLGTV